VRLAVISWNLFHGRDFPPDPALFTWRSRLLRMSERNRTHVQVNRDLFAEFGRVLASLDWDVALLQECPPRWHVPLARACDAEAHGALTSRNSLPALRSLLARLNPDLIASNEGGSNLTLVRGAAGAIRERRELVLQPGPRPERRILAFTRLVGGLCVANLHASAGAANRARAEAELRLAAQRSLAWAGDDPLVLGGDLNVRPRQSAIYAELAERYGLEGATGPDSLDHLLSRGLAVVQPPTELPPEARELARSDGLRLRLSDHPIVTAAFEAPERPD
jgi:endonuclease/exonuclease/phosphatase family metal-dependent hydrolase